VLMYDFRVTDSHARKGGYAGWWRRSDSGGGLRVGAELRLRHCGVDSIGPARAGARRTRVPRDSPLKLEVLVRKDAVAQHVTRAWLDDMLRQEPGCELGACFPDAGLQTGIQMGELGPESHQSNPAIDVSHPRSPSFVLLLQEDIDHTDNDEHR
jgi:hypothetical protein